MKKYKLVIFDLDGTLADTSPGIYNSIRYTQQRMLLPAISTEQMRSFIGPLSRDSYHRCFHLSGEQLDAALSFHKEYAMNRGYRELTFYDGIPRLLGLLRDEGMQTAVATLKAHTTAVKILETFGMMNTFDVVAGTDNYHPVTKAQLLEHCMESLSVSEKDAVLIGDSTFDALGAAQAGIDFIAVTYGFGFRNAADAEGYSCIAVCDSPDELEHILLL